MHRLPSHSTLRAFRFATVLLFLLAAALVAFLALGVTSLLTADRTLVGIFLWVGLALPVLGLAYLAIGARARCPLCMNPALVPRRCQKHRNARPFFGSHRFRVAVSVLFNGEFICPYCGEVTGMETRPRRRPRR